VAGIKKNQTRFLKFAYRDEARRIAAKLVVLSREGRPYRAVRRDWRCRLPRGPGCDVVDGLSRQTATATTAITPKINPLPTIIHDDTALGTATWK
jgi:hypothetical protein